MSLYPNLPEAFKEALRYVDLGDGEEKNKSEIIIRDLEKQMYNYNSQLDNSLIIIFGNLESKIKSSGLKMGDDKIKEIKRKVLNNMASHV